MPLEEDDLSTVSLAFVFILAGVILFGWEYGVAIATTSALAAQVVERKPLLRTAFNTAVYALSAFAAALPLFLLGGGTESEPVAITVYALWGGAAFVAVNFAFISLAISYHQRTPVLPLLQEELRLVGPAPSRSRPSWRRWPQRCGPPTRGGSSSWRGPFHRHAVPAFCARLTDRETSRTYRQLDASREQPRLRARSGDRAPLGDGDQVAAESLPRRRRRLQA